MEQTIEAKYERLEKIIFKEGVRQSETFLENKETASEQEKMGAQLLVMFHLLNIIDEDAHIDFKRAVAATFMEFNMTYAFGGCSFNFILDVNEAFESIPQFLINRYNIFQQDYEIALKRGMKIGHLGFYCLYVNLLANPDLRDQNTVLKIVSSDKPYRKKLNERLTTYLEIWRKTTVPVILKSSFPK